MAGGTRVEQDSLAVARIQHPPRRGIARLLPGRCARRADLGELNLGFTPDDQRENVLRNRQLLAEALTGDPTTPLATVRQIHSNVLVVGGPASACSEPGKPLGKGDGLMTDQPGVLLGIQTADCIPVLVADRRRRAVAAFHAGWRGTVKRIVENGIGRMRMEFGSRPEDLVAAIGPGILALLLRRRRRGLLRVRIAIHLRPGAFSRGLRYRSGAHQIPHALPDPARARPLAHRAQPSR